MPSGTVAPGGGSPGSATLPLDAISDRVPRTTEQFYWNLAYSEVDSESRHGNRWRESLGPRLSGLLRRGRPEELTSADRDRVRRGLRDARGPYLEGFLALPTDWSLGTIGTDLLGRVRLVRIPAFTAIAPDLLLDTFVSGLDAGLDTPGDRFAGRYRRLGPRFRTDRMRGAPVLVTAGPEGPLVEIDGLTRLSILCSRRRRGEAVPPRLEVMVGVCPRLAEWSFY